MKNYIHALVCLFFTFSVNATQTKQPNILFAVADDMSHASAYGYKFVQTPNFDKIAEQGVLFNRMYTPSSKCAPSRAIMLTGRNPWQLEEIANHRGKWPEKFKSVVEALTDNGYYSGFTGKGWGPGFPPKGRYLTGKIYNQIKVDVKATGLKVSPFDYAANFKAFLNDKPKNKPFFFWYGSKEPHRGYEFKSGVANGKSLEQLDFHPSYWRQSEAVKHDILDYAIEVEYTDMHLGRILKHIEYAGELDNTLIVVTSDNSMPFPRFKGHPHEYSTRLPFAIAWPGKIKNPGREFNQFASFTDLAPTFLQAAGIKEADSGMQQITGKSLFDVMQNKSTSRDDMLTGRERNDMCRPNGWSYPVRAYHQGDYVYMYNFEPNRWPACPPESGFRDTDGSPTKAQNLALDKQSKAYQLNWGKRPQEELYNVVQDPESINNLADKPEFSSLKQKLKETLFAKLKQQNDPRMMGNGKIFDEYAPHRHKEYDDLVEKETKRLAKQNKSK